MSLLTGLHVWKKMAGLLMLASVGVSLAYVAHSESYALTAILALLCILPFAIERKIEVYNAVLVVSVAYFIYFGLGSVYLSSHLPEYNWINRLDLTPEILNRGMVYVIIYFALFLVGYYLPLISASVRCAQERFLSKLPDVNRYDITPSKVPFLTILFLIVGWVSRIIIIKYHGYQILEFTKSPWVTTYPQFYLTLYYASLLPLFALAVVILMYLEKKNLSYGLLAAILMALELAYAIPSGSKERIGMIFYFMIILYSLKKGTPYKALLVSILVTVMLFFPLVTFYRSVYYGDVITDFTNALRLFGQYRTDMWDSLIDLFVFRLNHLPVVSVIIDKTPEIWDFEHGSTYSLFFTSFIPRIIWPGKPIISLSANDFGREYGLISPYDITTSVAMHWVGESFLNFGWFGVGMGFCYGLLYQFIYRYFSRHGNLTKLACIFYALALDMLFREGTFALQFSGLLKQYLFLFVFFLPFLYKTLNRKKAAVATP